MTHRCSNPAKGSLLGTFALADRAAFQLQKYEKDCDVRHVEEGEGKGGVGVGVGALRLGDTQGGLRSRPRTYNAIQLN